MVKIEFNGWKALLQIFEAIFWLPIFIPLYLYLQSLNLDDQTYWIVWIIACIIFWRWIRWGYKIRKAIEEWKE